MPTDRPLRGCAGVALGVLASERGARRGGGAAGWPGGRAAGGGGTAWPRKQAPRAWCCCSAGRGSPGRTSWRRRCGAGVCGAGRGRWAWGGVGRGPTTAGAAAPWSGVVESSVRDPVEPQDSFDRFPVGVLVAEGALKGGGVTKGSVDPGFRFSLSLFTLNVVVERLCWTRARIAKRGRTPVGGGPGVAAGGVVYHRGRRGCGGGDPGQRSPLAPHKGPTTFPACLSPCPRHRSQSVDRSRVCSWAAGIRTLTPHVFPCDLAHHSPPLRVSVLSSVKWG